MATPTTYQKVTDWNTEFLAAFPSHALYQDSAGTLATKTIEDPVGLVLDKKNGLVLGPELVVNGDNESALYTGATANPINATVARGAAPGGGFACVVTPTGGLVTHHATLNIAAGKAYKITVRVYVPTGSIATARLFDATDGSWLGSTSTVKDAWVTLQGIRPAGKAGAWYIGIGDTSTASIDGAVFYVDDLSVREIPGNHLIQPTSGNRPTWTRRVNILNATATLSTQTATTIAAQYKLSFTGAGSIALSGTATGTITAGTNLVTCTAGTLTLTVTGAVTLADMRLSSDVATPAYQAVRSATDYDYVGFPSKIKHNGTNSFLYTASTMDLSATDKVTVFVGVQKLSDASAGAVTEFSENSGPNNGTFALFAPSDIASAVYGFRSNGTAPQLTISNTVFAAPITSVLTGVGNISEDVVSLRGNGVSIASSSADQGTGNFGNYTLYVGSRAGTSRWFNGAWTQQIIRGALTSTAQEAQAETYVRNKTLAYPYYGYYGYPGQIGQSFTVGVSTLL